MKTTSSTHTFTGLDPNKEYYYSVTAVNDSGISPASATVKSQPGVAALNVTVNANDDSSLNITWTPVNGADDYVLYASKATPVTTSETPFTVGSATAMTHTRLNAGETWHYMIQARNEVGPVDSIQVSNTVVPQQPGSLTAYPKTSGGSVVLNWTASAGADGYRIYYKAGSHASLTTSA